MKRFTAFAALLLALLLPLRGFALTIACEIPTAAPVEHCIGHGHDTPASHAHHDCSAGCCMAVAAAPSPARLVRAPAAAALPSLRLTDHPALLTERLDRPPRG